MKRDRRAAEDAFVAGRYLDFLRAARGDEGNFDQALIKRLIPAVDLESVEFEAGATPSTLFELAAVVWDVDERLAISMFREAASGGSSAALAALGEGLSWIGHHEEAVIWLRKAIAAEAGNPARLAGLLGESLIGTGEFADLNEAEHLLKRGLEDSEEFGVPLAQLLLGQGRADEAREFLRRSVAAEVYGAALLLGNLLAEEPGNFDAAESAYTAGIASGDGHSAHNLAVMLLEIGEFARARELHELATAMGDPTPLEAPPNQS
ncbi:tetratricopeptide repeat protein [Microbacterium sp. NPDC090218]